MHGFWTSAKILSAYLDKLPQIQLDKDDLMVLENPELEKQLHAGNQAYKEDRYVHLKSRLDYYAVELGKVGVTR